MNQKECLSFHQRFCEEMMSLAKTKNADYCGTNQSAFSNLEAGEKLGIGLTEQGILFRMLDKFSRIISFVQKGELQVKSESVKDTLLDLANYAVFFAGYIEDKNAKSMEYKQLSLFDLVELDHCSSNGKENNA
jgi:hypothetical protein